MVVVEGIKYSEENVDLSGLNRIRFNLEGDEYIDIIVSEVSKKGIQISGSTALTIIPSVSNVVKVQIRD